MVSNGRATEPAKGLAYDLLYSGPEVETYEKTGIERLWRFK